MNIFNLLAQDEYRQQRTSRFIVESALFQLILSFIMIALYLNTEIKPLILLAIPVLFFLIYIVLRYIISGIEYSEVFSKDEYMQMKKRNIFRSISFATVFAVMMILVKESIAVAFIAGVLWLIMDTISLSNSYRKNQEL
ncbi:hypothetical protein [Viridibacillus sp. FSL H8-0110]|uniref:hypothetical protein n=1 Tax=Viridibacillus sp. FSL H8-0110 TaxID=2921376 RepID=UPI0030F4F01D